MLVVDQAVLLKMSFPSDVNSFEVIDGQRTTSVSSLPASMSIVTIPEEYAKAKEYEDSDLPDYNDLLTKRSTSFWTFTLDPEQERQLKKEEEDAKKMNDNQKLSESHQTLVKSVVESSSQQIVAPDAYSLELELQLRDLREENERLKIALENNNLIMKNQLKNLQEWQMQTNSDRQKILQQNEEAKTKIARLELENSNLKERIKDFEGVAGIKLVEELGVEVASLRSQLETYQQCESGNNDLKKQIDEMTIRIDDSNEKIQGFIKQIECLEQQLMKATGEINTIPILKEHIQMFERDFKVEELKKLAAMKELEQLETELDKVRKEKANLEVKLEQGTPNIELQAEEGSSQQTYSCPKCGSGFAQLQAVQTHVERCLDEDDYTFV